MSCAIANAVMNVIDDEKLQENALNVGQFLLNESMSLKNEFEMVGDVRGTGLFVGIELVKSKECRKPATAEANAIVGRMKNVHHVLISSDGPDDNVLKLKPPMVFTEDNAKEFLTAVRECLGHYNSNTEVKLELKNYKEMGFSTLQYIFRLHFAEKTNSNAPNEWCMQFTIESFCGEKGDSS